MATLNNLTTSSLREQAAEAIRAGIMAGEISAGEIYSVPALSAQLGVSATPVREAMLDLVSEGLVTPVRNRGFRVVSLTRHDLENILRIRLMLEVPSMGDVAEDHGGTALTRFRDLAEEMPETVRSNDLQAYIAADQDFHLGLLSLLNNPRLVDIVSMLRNQTRLIDIPRLAVSGHLLESANQHLGILEAISAQDRRLTEERMTTHLLETKKTWPNTENAVVAPGPGE